MTEQEKNIEEQEKQIIQIFNQTNYTREIILQKLKQHNNDTLSIIREYIGITPKVEKREVCKKNINQEIYRQIRIKFDDGMRQYREKHPIDIKEAANNLRQSEERKNNIN
jgi:hypothetical protein